MNKMTGFNLGFVVGMFEGEGCISFNYSNRKNPGKGYREYYTVHVIVGNSNKKLLKRFCDIVGVGKVVKKTKKPKRKHKTMYVWRISSQKKVFSFLAQVFPYLIEKKEKAVLVMEFLESRINCNPNAKANRLRKYTDYERSLYGEYRKLKSFVPTYIRNN